MSEFDDANDFAQVTEAYTEMAKSTPTRSMQGLLNDINAAAKFDDDEKEPAPGQPVQYQLYRNGYTPTNHTVNSLKPGCYDITADQQCVYVTPTAKPTGLLLELPEMRSEHVIKIIENFWNSEKDYKEGNEFVIGGAAFKAGIMLYGAAGTGKSCTIKIVSNKMVERGGTVFYGSASPVLITKFLADFAKIEPNRKCIVILEDIDSLIYNYGDGLYLEMLDSAKTIDNVLFIATTNYPEKLDPRIYNRPGRFSHVVKIGLPTPKAREAYLKAILKNHKDVEYIVDNTTNFSVDHLSALVNSHYREKKDLATEIERLRTLFKVPKVEEERAMGFHQDE